MVGFELQERVLQETSAQNRTLSHAATYALIMYVFIKSSFAMHWNFAGNRTVQPINFSVNVQLMETLFAASESRRVRHSLVWTVPYAGYESVIIAGKTVRIDKCSES